ncbi:MAG: amino acid adenylation domain-containing protein, partial [Cyclobacteriaceae bacterium]
VVIKQSNGDHEYLIGYYVSQEPVLKEKIVDALADRLPVYMLPEYYMHIESLPLTPNGKTDKGRLPLPDTDLTEVYVTPAGDLEVRLTELWSEVLKIPGVEISVTRGFFALGGHSLRATILINRINKELDVNIGLKDIFTYQDIRSLSAFIETSSQALQQPILPVAEQPYYPLSSAQRRMFILHEFDKDSVAYNMPDAILLKGILSKDRLESAFKTLLARHEILRTSFGLEGEQAVQYVHAELPFDISYYEGEDGSVDELIEDFVRPFDLRKAPLLRVGLISLGPEEQVLLFDIHHIVNDGLSQGILVNEFVGLYNGENPEAPTLHYKDYAVWQQEEAQQESAASDKAFWLDLYSDPAPSLELPMDHDRPAVRSQRGAVYGFELSGDEVAGLKELSARSGTTMYLTMLSIYAILLSRLGNSKDLVIGTPTSGRMHADVEGMLGMFVNTLALRVTVNAGATFEEYLTALKGRVLNCFDHQGYQYEELIDALQLARDTSRNPLFDVMFNYDHQEPTSGLGLEGLEASFYDRDSTIAKFDITLTVVEQAESLKLLFTYSDTLFDESTIVRFATYFKEITKAITSDAAIELSQIDVLSSEERFELLETFNDTKVAYPSGETVVSLFRFRAKLSPDHIAVSFGDERLSYAEIDERSDGLAKLLRTKGIVNGEVVGILLEPCTEMLIGLLGILKSGGAFLPIDPSYPSQRIAYMLEDSDHRLLLSTPSVIGKVGYEGEYLDLDDRDTYRGDPEVNLSNPSSEGCCYLIYTSGSTGFPKGVQVSHDSLVNLCHWHIRSYGLRETDHTTKYAGFGFDASVWEIFPTLLAGACLHIIDDSLRLDLPGLNAYYDQHGITVSFLPTQVCEQFVKLSNHSLRYLLTGGDALTAIGSTTYKVVNNYGPTEATVVSTSYELTGPESRIPIGSPIDNTQIYLLDEQMKLVPIGVIGELYIGGAGVAMGYYNKAEITSERFVANPYNSGRKMYRTGDMARWRKDGNIEFIGRADDQVQLRGYRIEPGEVRHRLMQHDQISECLVLPRLYQGENYLVGYYTSTEELDAENLRSYLLAYLPEYMVPQYYVWQESFRLTANGKIDR